MHRIRNASRRIALPEAEIPAGTAIGAQSMKLQSDAISKWAELVMESGIGFNL